MCVALFDHPRPFAAIAWSISSISCWSVRHTVVSPRGSSQPLAGKARVSVQVPPYVTSVVMKSSAATPVQLLRPIGAPEQNCVSVP